MSGGVDSTVLAHLLYESKFNFSIAHGNFKLRNEDSEKDEKFCKDLAKKMKVDFFSRSFDVKKRCAEKKISVQMAARELRYEWFEELTQDHHCDFILTAHQQNDVTETVLLHLVKGTGFKGLQGIQEKRGHLVRPLLNFSKKEIEEYARRKKIKFRTDKSNTEDKYQRNFLRLKVIPHLKKINPALDNTLQKSTFLFSQQNSMAEDYAAQRLMALREIRDSDIRIEKQKLILEKYPESLIHSLIQPLGFNFTQEKNLLRMISGEGQSTKILLSKSHAITVTGKHIIVQEAQKKRNPEVYYLLESDLKRYFEVQASRSFSIPQKNELIIEKSKLVFPLILRNPKQGDRFQPLGMKGKKLLSDFLKDEKVPLLQRKNKWLLVNGNSDILWVIGHRSDERYRVNPDTPALLIRLTHHD